MINTGAKISINTVKKKREIKNQQERKKSKVKKQPKTLTHTHTDMIPNGPKSIFLNPKDNKSENRKRPTIRTRRSRRRRVEVEKWRSGEVEKMQRHLQTL